MNNCTQFEPQWWPGCDIWFSGTINHRHSRLHIYPPTRSIIHSLGIYSEHTWEGRGLIDCTRFLTFKAVAYRMLAQFPWSTPNVATLVCHTFTPHCMFVYTKQIYPYALTCLSLPVRNELPPCLRCRQCPLLVQFFFFCFAQGSGWPNYCQTCRYTVLVALIYLLFNSASSFYVFPSADNVSTEHEKCQDKSQECKHACVRLVQLYEPEEWFVHHCPSKHILQPASFLPIDITSPHRFSALASQTNNPSQPYLSKYLP